MFSNLLSPAILIMNKLPFRLKIIFSTSILFFLLIIPSYTVVTNFIEKKTKYHKQLVGLTYNVLINDFVKYVQLHRGYINGYLSGNVDLKDNIEKSRELLEQKWVKLKSFDATHLKAISSTSIPFQLDFIGLDSLTPSNKKEDIFNTHSDIIENTFKLSSIISSQTHFNESEDIKASYIAFMLYRLLPQLNDQIGQIRGMTAKILAEKHLSKKQKREILDRYILAFSLNKQIDTAQYRANLSSHFSADTYLEVASSSLLDFLKVVDEHILLEENLQHDPNEFFKISTITIDNYNNLYDKLAISYKEIIKGMYYQLNREFLLIVTGFFIIILFALYVFGAFYVSIKRSMQKLEDASSAISRGEMEVELKVDTKDEIGNALLAFNKMSYKLKDNISFLDTYKLAIDQSSIVTKTDKRGVITYANQLFCKISGYTKDELIGKPHNIIRHPDMPKDVFEIMWKSIKKKQIWQGVIKNRAKDGSSYIVNATIMPILNSKQEIVEYISVRHDITELERSKEEIKKQKTDLLTGLANRNQLLEDLETYKKPTLLYFNIDDFTGLNNFYGTNAGDKVLKQIADTLREISQTTKSKAYRLNADEFLLLFEECMLTSISSQEIMSTTIEHIENESRNSTSITLCGGIVHEELHSSTKNLLTCVVLAHKMAKYKNKKFLIYRDVEFKNIDYKNNIEWIHKIKEAIEESRMTAYFQPIIDNKSSAIVKYESLVRMIDKDGKAISPFFFLDIAKKAKLFTQITKIVIDKSFKTFENLPLCNFSVNLTIEDILDKEVPPYLFKKLSKFSKPGNFIVEITETEEIKDYLIVKEFIKTVKKYGAKVAIDDFGSGYSNFEQVLDLDVDFIKIDGSLIKNIDTDENSKIITEAIISFSKKLGSQTIAEYVHSEGIHKIVKEMGADFSQGYYLGKPSANIV